MTEAVVRRVGFQWLKCPLCGSRNYYHRIKDDTYKCRRCSQLFRVNFTTEKVRKVKVWV